MKKEKSLYISIVALVFAVVALIMCIVCCCGKKAGNVEEVLTNNPEIIVNAMQGYEQKMKEKAQAEAQKVIEASLNEINNNPDSPVMGNPDGKVTLVEFFDYSCGYCHRLYPAIKQVIANNPDLKVVVKELTFVSPMSEYAAKAALAANQQGKYEAMYNAIFSYEGTLSQAKVDELAQKIGLDMEKYKTDMNSEKVASILKANSDLAAKVQITGVPTLVIGGKLVQTIDANVVQEAIDNAR